MYFWVFSFQLISASSLCSPELAVLPSALLPWSHQLDALVRGHIESNWKNEVVEQGGRGGLVTRQEYNEASQKEKPELKRKDQGQYGKEAPTEMGNLNLTINQQCTIHSSPNKYQL